LSPRKSHVTARFNDLTLGHRRRFTSERVAQDQPNVGLAHSEIIFIPHSNFKCVIQSVSAATTPDKLRQVHLIAQFPIDLPEVNTCEQFVRLSRLARTSKCLPKC